MSLKPFSIQHSEAFKAIFEYATTAILLVDINGIIRLSNPFCDQLFGYEPDELLTQSVEVLIPDKYRPTHSNLMKGFFTSPKRRSMGVGLELSAQKKSGEVFPVEINLGYYEASPEPMAIVFLSDITHRKRTEEALYEDEKRLRDIIQSISDAFMGFTNDWRYLYLNDQALSILNKSRNEVLGKSIWDVFPTSLGDNFEREFRLRHKGKLAPFTFKTHSGSTWWQVRVAKYNGGMALFCSDITETTFALEAQHQSEQQFSVIFNSSPAAISITELTTGIVTDINAAYTHLLGYNKEDLVGKSMLDSGIIRDIEIRNDIIASIQKSGPLRNFEFVAFTKNGNPIYMLASADIIRLAEKDYLLVASSDISASKIQLEELQQSEERFEKAFRLSPLALSISSIRDGRIIEVNNSFLELFGYTMKEVIGNTTLLLGLYANPNEREKTIAQLLEQGYIRNKELECRTKNNSPITVVVSMEMIELHGEDCVITTALNITDKKYTEERLRSYTDLLEQKVTERTLELTHALEREKEASEMKSRFMSMASHEFRTPLSTILSSTYLLEQLEDANEKSKHFNRIRSAVKNLTFILGEFLSLDKLEQQKVNIENVYFDLDAIASEVIDEVRIAYRLTLPVNYMHSGPTQIYQDKRILKNILLNLISNAAKYSPTNKFIKLKTSVEGHQLSMNVIDEGMGIPQEDQKYIFTKFFRAKNVNHIQGTGLGLSIVKRYVELLEGDVTFNSTPGVGTEFEVILPLKMSEQMVSDPAFSTRE